MQLRLGLEHAFAPLVAPFVALGALAHALLRFRVLDRLAAVGHRLRAVHVVSALPARRGRTQARTRGDKRLPLTWYCWCRASCFLRSFSIFSRVWRFWPGRSKPAERCSARSCWRGGASGGRTVPPRHDPRLTLQPLVLTKLGDRLR